jgi:sodium-dependent dicarboxylate transporter 2/3/5
MSAAMLKRASLAAGPLLALVILLFFSPDGVPDQARYVAAIAAWMALWWATEAVHVAVTAFLPLVLFPLVGVADIETAASSYAHPIIYLFFGGFIIALAVEKSGLHQRLALGIFSIVGVDARAIVGGFMFAAAVISMWISNTSTTIMMLPIAMSVVYVVRETMRNLSESELGNFELAMYLGLAYGATMGGVATLVGTPPNAFMAGFMSATYDIEVDFARWMIVGIPLTIVMLPLVWFVLVRVLFPVDFTASKQTQEHLLAQRKELGPLSSAETRTGIIFLALVLGWLFRKPIATLTDVAELSDPAIAMLAAIAVFLIPSGKKGEAIMNWSDTQRLPWGVLVLFGGGLALASGMASSGLTEWLGAMLAPLGTIHIAFLVIAACTMVIFLTELTSNLATTATFLPIMAALAVEIGIEPLILVAPVTLAASFAFMLPVATPPNAIVFSTGKISIKTMMRAGFILNLAGIVLLTIVALFLVPVVFGGA